MVIYFADQLCYTSTQSHMHSHLDILIFWYTENCIFKYTEIYTHNIYTHTNIYRNAFTDIQSYTSTYIRLAYVINSTVQ